MTNLYQNQQKAVIKKHSVKKSNQRYFKKRGAPTMFLLSCGLMSMLQCAGVKEQDTQMTLKNAPAFQVSAIDL